MGLFMGLFFLIVGLLRSGMQRLPIEFTAAVLLAGAVGGLLFGFLLPLGERRLGATVLGLVALGPLVAMQGFLDWHYSGDDWYGWSAYVITALTVGPLSGYLVRDQVFPELDEAGRSDHRGV
jgi:hypothetical protein